MTQTAKTTEAEFESMASEAINEMISVMCPHQIAEELDQLVIDLVTEAPDKWDDERARTFKAIRALTFVLRDKMQPQIISVGMN